jgi:hypothetical protein
VTGMRAEDRNNYILQSILGVVALNLIMKRAGLPISVKKGGIETLLYMNVTVVL